MQVDRNSDVFSNFISNFFRRYQDTEWKIHSVLTPCARHR
jgi:hypothetical protein